MSGVIQTAYGVNRASLRTPPNRSNGILATLVATAGVDLSDAISVADNQGNILSQVALFEEWDMVVGHQSLTIGFYGLLGLSSAPKGTYTATVNGLPSGRNGAAAEIALFEVNGLQSLDQTGTNGSTGSMNSVATGTACTAINAHSNDLVIAAFGVPDTDAWTSAPRYPPASGYTGVFSEVISPAGTGLFGAVQVAYKAVDAVETSIADWGNLATGAGYAWPWVSAVASFGVSASAPRTSRQSLPLAGVAALAPLAWVIERRRKRSLATAARAAAAASEPERTTSDTA